MSLKLPLALLALMISSATFAKNYMALMGGGGEPTGDKTIFDDEIKGVSFFLKNNNWSPTVSYNGGHKNTEGILKPLQSKMSSPITRFTANNYEKIISEYEQKIKSGQITRGDQVVLYIASHGAINAGKDTTHKISTSGEKAQDLIHLTGSKLVSLDRLKNLSQLAQSKGIKLGIIDMSCHSGSTQVLANSNTCVISSTGPNHFAWGGTPTTFAAQFSRNMKKGQSLEDVFINANKVKSDVSFPMISSPAGKAIQTKIYKEISPFLFDTRSEITTAKMKSYFEQEYAKNQCLIIDKNYDKLMSFVDEMDTIVKYQDFNQLRSMIDEYYDLQKGLRNSLKTQKAPALTQKQTFCTTIFNKKQCVTHSMSNIAAMDFSKSSYFLQSQLKMSRPPTTIDIQGQLDLLKQMEQSRIKFFQDYPQLANTTVTFKDLNIKDKTRRLSKGISEEFQKAYPNVYNNIAVEKRTQPNPCRDIKL